ncbi:MAG: transcription elongation factor GreA [Armatimonadetes bacterium]|nr:transcription elongation factor GreA [Armatimonadota bacterium]
MPQTEKETILTPEGLKQLEEKLEQYKAVYRREVAERIRQAKEFGDISENSEYEDAKLEQAFVEGQILSLEKMIRNAKILDEASIHTDVVSVGTTVKVKDQESGEVCEYTIVGSAECDPKRGRISNESPVGAGLLGQNKGKIATIKTPGGTVKYKIMEIKR